MTTAGKVFTVLTLLLGFGYLYLLTPVTQSLIADQKQILDTQKQEPPLREAVDKLEADRVRLTYELNRIKDKITAESTKHANQLDIVQSQLSLLTDLEKFERTAVLHLQNSVGDIKTQIDARQAEKAQLEKDIADYQMRTQERTQEVAQLREALQQAREKLARTLSQSQETIERLQQPTNSSAGKGSVALE
jgi:chromosome segregation ATPase